jgi:very-short-patch-repair endonuclease
MQNRPSSSFETRRRQLIEARARQHRASLNVPEQRLARALAGGRLGVYFRRQVVLGEYIVDLLAPAIHLVVEIDGRCHELRRRADARRDEKLRRLGYVVLRLEAELVLRNLPLAVERVRQAVEALRRHA